MRKLDDTNRTRERSVRHSWVKAGRGFNAALFVELRSKASGETGRPRFVYIYHLVSSTLRQARHRNVEI